MQRSICGKASRRRRGAVLPWLVLSVTVICQLGAGALSALLVLSVTGYLHGDARSYGAAAALMGAGYVVGAAAAGRLVRAAGTRAVICGGLFAAAALTAAYALAGDVPAGLALLTGWSAAIAVLNTSTAPLLMGAAPDGYLGRVMALWGDSTAWWRVVHADGSLVPGHERTALEHYRAEGTPLRPSAGGPPSRVDMRLARWAGEET